jgi:hypothetical protein
LQKRPFSQASIGPKFTGQVKTIFGRMTGTGLEIPEWLKVLRDTATQKQSDFEATAPAFRARPSNGQ